MRTRGINFWENKILSELSKNTEKQFISQSPRPKNPTEEQNYQIAAYFVFQQHKMASQITFLEDNKMSFKSANTVQTNIVKRLPTGLECYPKTGPDLMRV